jgi:hypothetical protein
MTTTAKRLVAGSVLTGTAATYYTAPSSTRAVIKSATLANATGAPVTAVVYIVPAAGTAGAANTFIAGQVVAAGATYTCPELINHVIHPCETLQASGNGMSFGVSGAEIV